MQPHIEGLSSSSLGCEVQGSYLILSLVRCQNFDPISLLICCVLITSLHLSSVLLLQFSNQAAVLGVVAGVCLSLIMNDRVFVADIQAILTVPF